MISKVNGKNVLEIFQNFQIDETLPKHGGKDENVDSSLRISGGNFTHSMILSNDGEVYFGDDVVNRRRKNGRMVKKKNGEVVWMDWTPSFFVRFIRLFKPNYVPAIEKESEPLVVPAKNIREFFLSFIKETKELKAVADIADYYNDAIEKTHTSGQIGLQEKLKSLLEVSRAEAQLIGMNSKKYVTEDQVIDFCEEINYDKNIKLTWIKRFVKIIPSDIIDIKKIYDDKRIFDNYVILHYDPNNDATEYTEKEIEEIKKDPILFGVVANSRKLYYIADWKDDYCDLTLDKMFETLGEKVKNINNRTVKTAIDKAQF